MPHRATVINSYVSANRRSALYMPAGKTSYMLGIYTPALNGPAIFTVEFWILPKDTSVVQANDMILINNATTNFGWFTYITNPQVLELDYQDGTTPHFADAPTTGGVWMHYAFSWGGTGTGVTTWKNGLAIGTGAVVALPADAGNPALRIGRNADAGIPYGTYAIQDIRYSNNVRYSATFKPPTTPFIKDANTIGLWPCDEGFGNVARDRSGNNNTLTMTFGSGTSPASSLPWWGPGRL